ncbi:CIC11C00000000706 [Sungouiella intermedia]|uniref:Pre-mRNA-splicing factor ISY1 n=1 Tax=Sungouiella intermedia TaxID=45354 RepID=A0A1L0BB37_9ASCO|nr:CIC11C00000000706 [[Candida] intermedia]
MSRNKEKAQSALNRYQAQVSKEAGVLESDPSQRPKYVQSVESLPQAEKWRQTIVTEISVKLTKINDPTCPTSEIRELNDSLNKLHREKRAWEYHIKNLGGNDYISYGSQVQGINVKGTRYYGRARELEEVKMSKGREEGKNERVETKKWNPALEYYGIYDDLDDAEGDGPYGSASWNVPIDHDKINVMAEINTALGEKILPAPFVVRKDNKEKLPTSADVEKWLVEKKRAELLAQLEL